MSPEQLAGNHVDGRSDLFSLGVTMFLLLTGRWPFRAESLTNLMYNITNEPHPDISELGFELPAMAAIKAVIDRALQKDPADRFTNGSEFAAAVRECLAQMPSFDGQPSEMSQAAS
jgi:serine/threonine-protein kinase